MRDGAVNAEMTAESITGPAGNEAEGGGRVNQRSGDLVHGAVAADGDDEVAAVVERTGGEFGGVAGTLGQDEFGAIFVGERPQRGKRARGATGAGIDDEAGFQTAMEAGAPSKFPPRGALVLCGAKDGVGAFAFAEEEVLAEEEIGGREGTREFGGTDVVHVDAAAFDVFAGLAF